MDKIWVRPMKREDIRQVLNIERLCFPTPWSYEAFRVELEGNHCARYVVAEQEGVWLRAMEVCGLSWMKPI